ncbi:rhodanese-like domain-containing protein [Paenibacillus sambharensis]|uniref:Rhodanese-like domain-containing protein n=1 Tax=Paenibacillus sambharensis TaxID=1803190 RepID=A0A2W1LBF1_9BACL|nr:rhodanese-like domain-containing protein [Paenibacillus sambharensis]PZD96233.1 rhodanese-like domain-containing protein [Paenibacillus sambharensis]
MYPEITTTELAERLRKGEKLNLVDVRERDEWQEEHIAEARLIPMSELEDRLDELNAGEEPVILICRSGGRSGKVCDYLHAQGVSVTNVTGGMLSWMEATVSGE